MRHFDFQVLSGPDCQTGAILRSTDVFFTGNQENYSTLRAVLAQGLHITAEPTAEKRLCRVRVWTIKVHAYSQD